MARYIEGWKLHNTGGLTCRAIGQRQSGMNYLTYLLEHPKARGLHFTRKGELSKRHHRVVVTWRGQHNPFTGSAN